MSLRYSTGNEKGKKIPRLASSYPFIQQLDVIFPSDDELENALLPLETHYAKGKTTLSDVIASAKELGPENNLTVLSTDFDDGDVWYIDPRGILTLCVAKDTYETLGLVGKKVVLGYGRKHPHEERHVINIPLQANTESEGNKKRRSSALKAWDGRREPWSILCTSKDLAKLARLGSVRQVKCQKTSMNDVRIPVVDLPPRPNGSQDDIDDWNEHLHGLFEWVGMAGLGAQRLQANDRVDPHVSLYESPGPSNVGNITHLRWRGFLGPDFVQSIIDTVTKISSPQFVSITSHNYPYTPVPHLPRSAFTSEAGFVTPVVDPTRRSGDTWSMIFIPDPKAGSLASVVAETAN
ncbi:ribonuclease P 40kDa subunit-domain-containing protein [Desarmillaria tabescens]|uniref:Ribonuclease P 40kDa subunit-domain-containing protein n=1 Tax=Armillaria tabescens TaxID=1929756 RepID=A0AA39U4S3_ARMTA|nr:ribonuclease P 40kDa subunit-domain-containing protein [Desarmillaria tabescens]KAK0467010.1 ribonuclease P 40kDa subunit-domain-containing protein [Desarmillaria tabescens]